MDLRQLSTGQAAGSHSESLESNPERRDPIDCMASFLKPTYGSKGRRPTAIARRRGVWGRVLVVALVAATGLAGQAPAAHADGARDQQWYLDRMDVDKIWKKTTGEGIKIAVIDSGVNPSTPSLRGQVLPGRDASIPEGGGPDTSDRTGQGTTTAELIAGTGKGGGLQGLAPGAKIIPIRVPMLKHDELPSIYDHLDQAIRMALKLDAKIITISLGSQYAIGAGLTGQNYSLQDALAKDVLVFAGSGDNAKKGNKPLFPAQYLEVVSVAATDPEGRVAGFSQHGERVNISAPGTDIPRWCDASFQRYCPGGGGTHVSAALASAAAALIWSLHPDWTASQVLRVMYDSAGRGDDWEPGTVSSYVGYGVIRPGAHINRGLGNPGAPDRGEMPKFIQPVDYVPTTLPPTPAKTTESETPPSSQTAPTPPTSTTTANDRKPKTPMLLAAGAATAMVLTVVAVWGVRRVRRSG
ncbi:S8 family serine peptidase [Streptomyces sp. NPDC047974]|uniref:S8 family serine peptidase n=1 Tax=Streptomyces sp. NPDC047974 TaxID=3154343 RepID=UPI00340262E7